MKAKQSIKMDDFRRNIKKIGQMILSQLLDLFCIIFKLELEQNISNVHAKSMHASFLRFKKFRTKSQVLLFSEFSLCKHACHIKFVRVVGRALLF